jgi:MoaA/NifB/PqqE/SkfB family radical SAM enzyme
MGGKPVKKKHRLKHGANQLLFALGKTHPVTGPLKAFWEITYRCNSRCLNCDIWQRKSSGELTTDQAFSVLKQLKELHVPHISFSGGEVFLRKDIFEVLQAATEMGFKYSINTNASLLNEERCSKLARTPAESIYISLDGATAETHDKVRGVDGSFNQVMAAVEQLKQTRDPERTKIFFNTCINKLNLAELPQIPELVLEHGIDGLTMTVVQNVEVYGPSDDMLLDKTDLATLMQTIDLLLEKYSSLLPHMPEYFRNFKYAVNDQDRLYKYRCVAGYAMLMIHPEGDVFSCPVAFEKVGNVTEQPLKEIWYNNFRDLRCRIKAGKHPICWFDCVAPMNILLSYLHPLKIRHLMDSELLEYIKHKL